MDRLPDGTEIGTVRLRVADLERQAGFYREVLGLRAPPTAGGAEVALGARAGARPLLVLEPNPDAPPAPRRSTGLFHVALLLPTRRALAETIIRVRDAGWPFQGFADHAVSEAAYLADAEGNGLELYADRPRSEWVRNGPEYYMTTLPLDLEGLLSEADGTRSGMAGDAPAAPPRIDEGATVGHVHFRVSSLDSAERFYADRVGFDVTVRGYPGALFVSAGGYHHHVGLNVWAGAGAPRPPAGSRGLVSFELVVPDADARGRLLDGAESGTLDDPDGIAVRVVEPAATIPLPSDPTAGS